MVGHITYFRVVFENNPRGIFLDGQTLAGVATIFQRQPKQVNRILLVVIGRGRIREKSDTIHGDYNFLRQEIVLADFIGGHTLTPGDYKYNFSYKLKANLCPTFYGKKGFVHYEIVISLIGQDGKEGHPGMQYKHPFSLIRSMNTMMYREPHKLKPLEKTKTISVCYCCCMCSEPFNITVQFPSRTFCPGEWLFIHLICITNTAEGLYHIKTKLMKHIKYTHLNGLEATTEQVELAEVTKKHSELSNGKEYDVGMKLPLTQATNEHSVPELVTITYKLQVEVELLTFFDETARFDFDVPIHVQNLDLFTHDYCTYKKQKEVITTQPYPSSNWNNSPNNQPGTYPTPGWVPPSTVLPVYPVETGLPKIGFDNVLRADPTNVAPSVPVPGQSANCPYPVPVPGQSSICPYPPHVPTAVTTNNPTPPYPTFQSTPTGPSPMSSVPENSVIGQPKNNTAPAETFWPTAPKSETIYVAPSVTIQTSQTTSGVTPYPDNTSIANVPTETPSYTTISPTTPTNFSATPSSAETPMPSATTAPTRSYSPMPFDHTSKTVNYSHVRNEHSPATTRYSPIPFNDSTIAERNNIVPSAPIFDDAATNKFEPVKPPSEAFGANSPLISPDSAGESLEISGYPDTLKNETEQLTQEQDLNKGILLVVIGRGRTWDTVNETHRDYYFLRDEAVLADFGAGRLLLADDYKYNFSYKLQDKLCPTFYGRRGFVHYELVITLVAQDGGEEYPVKQYKHPFFVIRTMSMTRYEPHLKLKPLEQTKSIEVCYSCFTVSKSFSITVQFPNKAFCPGDWLFIRLICDSNLDEKVQLIKTKLMQYIKYKHKNRLETITEEIRLTKVRTEFSGSIKEKEFVVGMKLPLTQATNEHSIPDFVTITYRLQIEAELLTSCDDRAQFYFDVPIHVQNLDLFTHDYCTLKQKKEVITTQPHRLSSWNNTPVHQPGMQPTPGWMPQGSGPVYPVETGLPKIGFDNVLRADPTNVAPSAPAPGQSSNCPYPPKYVPTAGTTNDPPPPYPTFQSTPTGPNPMSSVTANSVIGQPKNNPALAETFRPTAPESETTYVAPSATIQTSQTTSELTPYPENTSIANVPTETPSYTTISPTTPTNFSATPSSAENPMPSATTAPTRSYSPMTFDYNSRTVNYSHVRDEHSSATTRYSPIPFNDSTIAERNNTVPSAPIFDDAATNKFEPVKPPSEAFGASSPLISPDSAGESLEISGYPDTLNTETEQLTQKENLTKDRKKMVGERKKKFQ